MTKSDLSELAALNRQIAERDQIIRALLERLNVVHYAYPNLLFCDTCFGMVELDYHQRTGAVHEYETITPEHLALLVHDSDCPYRRAIELTTDSAPTPD